MATLDISLKPETPLETALPANPLLTVDYTRTLPSDDDESTTRDRETDDGADPEVRTAAGQEVAVISTALSASLHVVDYAQDMPVTLTIGSASGTTLLTIDDLQPNVDPRNAASFGLAVSLTTAQHDAIHEALTPSPPVVDRRLVRSARFVPVGFPTPRYRSMTLLVAPVREQDLSDDLLRDLFDTDVFGPTARRLPEERLALLATLPLGEITTADVELTGRFHVDISVNHIAASESAGWLWLLSGDETFVGLQPESDLASGRPEVAILLPAPSRLDEEESPADTEGDPSSTPVPLDATEDELLSDPELFSADPSNSCRPFSNHGRIVSETRFHTILRVEQPTIGGRQSVPPPEKIAPYSPVFPVDTAVFARLSDVTDPVDDVSRRPPVGRIVQRARRLLTGRAAKAGTVAAAEERRNWTAAKSRGRYVLTGDEPLDWEGDSYPYQASSLAFGHILQHQVATRFAGRSTGLVAGTIALAPRQTKRIVTVTSSIADTLTRTEHTTARDRLDQTTTRDFGYRDQVSATLREWAKGGSDSSMTGVAGGVGFALPGFVIGGGAAHGESHSSSWARGGRDVAAQETQSLKDALRGHGDSQRSLASKVVREETQSETSQAVSEVLRNANYAHSLTVVFYEILHHLRVDTKLVGARECVFVPFPLGPFTYERAWRWRDTLLSGLRDPGLGTALARFDEIDPDGSYDGDIPEGPRAHHPVNHVQGSIELRLGIERPPDDDDDDDVKMQAALAQWELLGPFMSHSVQAVRARLRRAESDRDATFQRDVAPGVAARWVDTLMLVDGSGNRLNGSLDFSLASRYRFGSTVKVNFTYRPFSPTELRRTDLVNLTLEPTRALSAGSVASLERIEYRYFTDTFDHAVSSGRATHDLVDPAGELDAASIHIPLTRFEQRDEVRDLLDSAAELLSHLNEHSEYYHKLILWQMDRDKLFMMLDSLQLRPNDTRSVASVVEKEPVAIVGNSLVYAVAGGAHIGVDGHENPDALHHYYVDPGARPDPIRVSLPTAGLYAQTIMDDCGALEEHLGSTDWILGEPDPELAGITPEMLGSRRASTPDVSPTEFGTPIINLQNAAAPPAPQGFGDVLGALQNANAFRDMAGLAGTQANAMGAFTGAAELAGGFAAKAVELRKAEMAAKTANEKLNVLKKAKDAGLTSEPEAVRTGDKIISEMARPVDTSVSTDELETLAETADERQVDLEVDKPSGKAKVTPKRNDRRGPTSGLTTKDFRFTFVGPHNRLLDGTWGVRIGTQGPAHFDQISVARSELRIDGVDVDRSERLSILVVSNGNTQSSQVLDETSQFYFSASQSFEVPVGKKVFVKVTAQEKSIQRESAVQLSRAEILEATFGVDGSIKVSAGLLGGILGGEISTGMEFKEVRTDSSNSATGEVWKYSIEVLTRNLTIELEDV